MNICHAEIVWFTMWFICILGIGRTQPNPAGNYTTPDGTVVPMGTSLTSASGTSLLYNEYPLI